MPLPAPFTVRELQELLRAIRLISQEDAHCNVAMDAASVRAKASAHQKLEAMQREQNGKS